MLQSLRESMTGVVAKIIVALVIGAMVLFGVESLFVNSVGGSEVATVNGEDVEDIELRRAIEQQKSRLRQQFQLEDDSELLQDEQLRTPALMSLVRQKALSQAAAEAGMNVSPEIIKAQLAQAFSRDGEFDAALMNNYIAGYGFTPATLAQSEANAYVLRQLFGGLNQSEFITDAETAAMAAIAGQKRSFSTVTISRAKVEADVVVSEDEITAYYEGNAAQFTEPEKVSLDYVEVSIAELAKAQEVAEADIRAEYDREVADFESKTELTISHILIEDNNQERIDAVAAKLAAGESFAGVAQTDSDDLGSKGLGGQLGTLIEGAFPAEFEAAAKALTEGSVSEPVKTDAGTHFIRMDKKVVSEVPTFDSRREALAAMLREQKAASEYIAKVQTLEEVSFGASDLATTADALGVSVKTTPLFARGQGVDIAELPAVARAVFEDDVYAQNQNSRVIELESDRAVVIRLKEKVAAKLQPLDLVKADIEAQLKEEKVSSALEELAQTVVTEVAAGKSASDVAEAMGYEASEYEAIERSSADVDFAISREVFSMARPAEGGVVTATVPNADGVAVVALSQVIDGTTDALPAEQLNAMTQQLLSQQAGGSVKAFEDAVFGAAEYELK